MERADLDFPNLPFAYMRTDANARCWYRDGVWSDIEMTSDEHIPMHMAAVCFHYGQAIFEGLKAYERPDGRVQTFRLDENADRLQRSARKLMMEPVPIDTFREAVHRTVNANRRFVPPHGSGASLYIRPFEVGSGAEVGVKPSSEYLFCVFVTPVGPYYKAGFTPVRIRVEEEVHRAVPGGVGDVKAAGNYAASMRATVAARAAGFSEVLYLDAVKNAFIDESGSSNFFGIKGNTFVTPASSSILPSITNMSVRTLVADMGLEVEQRPISVDELGSFDETGALGTAAIISPIESITHGDVEHVYCRDGKAGPIVTALYERLLAIQTGEADDPYGWTEVVPEA